MSTDATVVIKGRSELGLAVKQAEQQLKGLARQGELVGKIFRGGAIVGAVLAFERLAENAQKAAESMGDRGAARSLKALNKEIDNLKSKGTNLIGKVLGNAYSAIAGDAQAKLAEQVQFLEGMQGRSFVAAFYKDIGTGYFTAAEGAAKLLELQKQLAVYENNQSARNRTRRAPGGSRNKYNVSVGEATGKPATAKDILSQFDEIAISARQISVGAMEQMYQDMDAATQTAIQQQVSEWSNLEGQINELLRAGRISPGDAAARSSELVSGYFEDIQITAEKIFPPSEQEKLSVFAEQAGRNLQDAFATFLFDPFQDGLKGMLAGFLDTIRQMVAQLAAQEILSAFFSWGASAFGGGVGKTFASLGRGLTARASGGPVMAGGAYMVGERGPELFVPGSSGSIVPNNAMGGGISLAYNIDARGADAERIMAIMPGLLQRTKTETVAEIRNLVARGRM